MDTYSGSDPFGNEGATGFASFVREVLNDNTRTDSWSLVITK